jgi:DNA polymerase III alpha subunit
MFDTPPFQLPALLDYSPAQRLRDEFELLRIVVGPHLMSWFRPLLARFPSRDRPTPVLCDSRQLRSLVGRSVMLAGIVAAARHTPTKNGDTMQFVTLEDEYGIFEVTLFPDICSRVPYLRLGPYRVQGYVEEQHGVVTITAKRFELVPLEKQPWGEDAQINSVRTYSPDEQSTMHRHDAPDNVRMS